jgi:TRAP-type C4-dicarboxylate transport system permease large subunit
VAVSYGVDPVHMGIIFLANMQIGYFTPPVGMNLFIASFRFEKPVAELYRATIPFMIVLLVAVLVITYLPQLSLFFL